MPSLKRSLNVDVVDEVSDDEGGALIGILQKVNINLNYINAAVYLLVICMWFRLRTFKMQKIIMQKNATTKKCSSMP